MADEIIITIRGGVVTSVVANGDITVTVVDYDNIAEGDDMPDLPTGVTADVDGDLEFWKPWVDGFIH